MGAYGAMGRAENAARCHHGGLLFAAVTLAVVAASDPAHADPGGARRAPSSQPSAPSSQPTTPRSAPSAPSTQPSAPSTQPSARRSQPSRRPAKRRAARSAASERRVPAPVYETVVVAPETRRARPREDRAAASSVITADRTPRSGESASELLSELPGVMVTRLGALGSLATVSLRGSSPNQVGVYLDGIPLNAAVGGGVDLGMIPIGDMSRVEVYRGMSPIGFGASALGGIVSILTRMPRDNNVAAEVGGGSFGTVFAGLQGTGVYRRAGGLVSLRLLQSDGNFTFIDDNGTAANPADDASAYRRNNQLTQLDGTARAHVELPGRRELTGTVWLLGRDQGLSGRAPFQAHDAELITRRAIAALRYRSRSDLGVGGRLALQLWSVALEQRLLDEDGEVALGQHRTRDRTLRVGATARGRKAVTDWLRLESIVEGRYEHFAPRNELAADPSGPPARRGFAAAGIEGWMIWSALNLRIQPSLRVEVAHDTLIDRSLFGGFEEVSEPETHVLPIARLALVQRPLSWLAIKANGGRFARMPSLRERYGNTGFYRGNPQLAPERGFNVDVGLSLELERGWLALRFDSSLFASWVDDLIQLEQGDYYLRANNIGRAAIRGVEHALSATLLRYGRLVAQATFTDARDTSDIAANNGKQLPLRPEFRFYVRPELRGFPLAGRWRVGAYVDVTQISGNFVDPANQVQWPARTLLGAGCYLDAGPTGIRLIGSARNLTDARFNDFAGFPLPGRSFFITLKWSTDKVQGGT